MLQLIPPNESHRQEWESIMSEWDESRKRPRIFFQDSYDMFLNKVSNTSHSDDEINQISKSSVFFLKDSESDKILGFFWLRHNLRFRGDDTCGGHIGYGIRPSERRKGYGKDGLKLLLSEAKNLGLEKVFIACDEDNVASIKMIEANGGILESVFQKDNIKRRRYSIDMNQMKL